MGVSSSKNKCNSVTLLSNTCTGDLYSNSGTTTPKGKVLPFDPRSPTENFSRTPITVCISNNETVTPATATSAAVPAVTILDVDPRSPSQQVIRTPIIIENSSKHLTTNTSLSQPNFSTPQPGRDSLARASLSNICTDDAPGAMLLLKEMAGTASSATDADNDQESDPRSPTVTVPRTPLEDRQFADSINKRLFFNQSNDAGADISASEGSHPIVDRVATDLLKTNTENSVNTYDSNTGNTTENFESATSMSATTGNDGNDTHNFDSTGNENDKNISNCSNTSGIERNITDTSHSNSNEDFKDNPNKSSIPEKEVNYTNTSDLNDNGTNNDNYTNDPTGKEETVSSGNDKELSDQKSRLPLTSVAQNNTSSSRRGTPRAMLQAKQCKILEEEFTKNQRNILNQLVQDEENIAPVPSMTQFVEQI